MKGINKAILVGSVWKDPVIRDTKNGSKIAQVSMVTESGWGEYKKADWHTVIFFGKQADVVDSFVTKGTNLYVEGSIDYRKYTDKNGVEKYTTDIKGQMLQMINSPDAYKEVEDSTPEVKREVSSSAREEMASITKEVTDDVPF
jgi:single-strand DNA-binding protein|tara:strand:+ start:699 stop:1130 length:432 start_codon:yes stop_codon:yes gene_type:complete